MKDNELITKLASGELDEQFEDLYGAAAVKKQRERYISAVHSFVSLYGKGHDVRLFSVPGRSEICGNHLDHNDGRVVAASLNIDIIAAAAVTSGNLINIKSEGKPRYAVNSTDTRASAERSQRAAALNRGVADAVIKKGFSVGGHSMYTTSEVVPGSGTSSSAAFEVLSASIANVLFCGGALDNTELAKIGRYAENVHFGKPCGLMDQLACALGGVTAMDLENSDAPETVSMDFDLAAAGLDLCIVNTGGSHSSLNAEFSSIPAEMKLVANYFGKKSMRGVTLEELTDCSGEIRNMLGDRAFLRAMHYVTEFERVGLITEAISKKDIVGFLRIINDSGVSSAISLQNIYSPRSVAHQAISVGLAYAAQLLGREGAYRVHGGGFAGTIQAFVPQDMTSYFKDGMDKVFGNGSCRVLTIRSKGSVCVL